MKEKMMKALAIVLALLCMTAASAALAETMAEGADSDWYMNVLADENVIAEYPYHAFIDLNGNGVPVLIISTTQESFIGDEDRAVVYLYCEGEPKQVMEVGGAAGDVFYCNLDEHTLTHYYRFSGEAHIEIYHAVDGALELVTTVDSYGPGHGPDGSNEETVYMQDGAPITEEEANELWGVYATDNAVYYEPMA